MQTIELNKIKGYVNLANKAGYLIIGAENLKYYKKKLYLVLYAQNSGRDIQKIVKNFKTNPSVVVIEIDNQDFTKIVSIENCKIVGIKNLGLSKEIIKIIRGE